MLDATHRILAGHGKITARRVLDLLQDQGYAVEARSTVQGFIDQLTDLGIRAPSGEILIPPLYAAYLLLDLPQLNRPALLDTVRRHDQEVEGLQRNANQ